MTIERTGGEIIIKMPDSTNMFDLQSFLDFLSYKNATKDSKAMQSQVDELAASVKNSWWKKNKSKKIK